MNPISTTGRDSQGSFREQIEHFGTLFLVAESPGGVVGVLLGSHDFRKGWINRIAVDPDHRRHGVASRLMDACEGAFQALGIDIYAALVEINNEPSARLFERAGYRRDIPVHYFHKRLRSDV